MSDAKIPREFTAFKEKYGLRLNDRQCAAAASVEGPTLLLAVPGSGKTTVLVSRLGYMVLEKGIDPAAILTMTYTRAAAADMRERYRSFFGGDSADALLFCTINSLCLRVIGDYSRNFSSTGRPPFVTVNEERQTGYLRDIVISETGEFPTPGELGEIKTFIAYAKNMMLTKEQIRERDNEGKGYAGICEIYNKTLVSRGEMDYDDQLVYTRRLLLKYPPLLEKYRKKYRYLCVDEAQDTSLIQHEIIKLLAGGEHNLFMVGDEDQSIYGFRAAYPQALLNFEKDHPGARVMYLSQNYRSVPGVVDAANRLIRANESRREKNMTADRTGGDQIRIVKVANSRAQIAYLCKALADCKDDTAVLYRDNESAVPIIDRLDREGIPFRLRGGDIPFFTHRIVRDVRDILSLCLDPTNVRVFERVAPRMGLYVSKSDISDACREAERTGAAPLDVLSDSLDAGFPLKNVNSLRTHLKNMRRETAGRAVYRIVHFTGYEEYLDRMHPDSRKPDILQTIADRTPTIEEFFDRLDALEALAAERTDPPGCCLTLSTIHSAKGLEYDSVWIVDAFNGVLPQKAVRVTKKTPKEQVDALEEDRRLFYVAVTRARNRLNIFDIADKNAQFLRELEEKSENGGAPAFGRYTHSPFRTQNNRAARENEKAYPENGPTARIGSGGLLTLGMDWVPVPGETVYHHRFGKGIVLSVSGSGQYVTLKFQSGQVKKLDRALALSNNMLCKYT